MSEWKVTLSLNPGAGVKPFIYTYLLLIVCAAEREVRGSIPVWEYVLQGPMSEFETR